MGHFRMGTCDTSCGLPGPFTSQLMRLSCSGLQARQPASTAGPQLATPQPQKRSACLGKRGVGISSLSACHSSACCGTCRVGRRCRAGRAEWRGW